MKGNEMTIKELDKKTQAALKADFSLHVALIMKQDNMSKANASWRAWVEGSKGLHDRLGQKELPLEVKK